MDWWIVLALVFSGFLALLLTGLPVAFSFTFVNLVAVIFLWGGQAGLQQIVRSIYAAVADWSLVPVAMFVLMGETMFHSGVAFRMIEALDKWLGQLPGRLSVLAVVGGTMFSTCSGSSMAATALFGSTLVPEMERRGYSKVMSLGPIMGAGGLAIMIPPSVLAVLLASSAEVSVGKVLIGGIIPGLILATLYLVYIVARCWIQPSLAPSYAVVAEPLSRKVSLLLRNVLPLGLIIFAVLGLIFLGVASPTEASATGALATFVVAALCKSLNRKTLSKVLLSTAQVTIMILMIFTGSVAFGQVLAFSGATRGLSELAIGSGLHPIMLVVLMQFTLLFLGCFIDQISTILVTVPIFWPILNASGVDTIWFAVIMLLNLELGTLTPPLGLGLFVMKSVASPDTTWGDMYRAVLPIVGLQLLAMAIMIAFPATIRWLPDLAIR